MKRSLILLAACAALFASQNAGAQDLKTGYFIDNYVYGYKLNPALQPKVGNTFVGFVVNDIALSGQTNVGISNVLFPLNGKLVTGLNENIPADTFLGGLKDDNKALVGVNLNLLSIGSRTNHGFFTFDVSLKSNLGLAIPKSFAEFLKIGGTGNSYVVENIALSTRNYLEAAFGYSLNIGSKLTVGATVKGLVGLANVNAQVDKLGIDITDTGMTIAGNGTLEGSAKMLDIPTENGEFKFDELQFSGVGVSGFGAAVDLGVVFKPIDGLTLSGAILDLGGISWKNNVNGVMSGSKTFEGDDIGNLEDDMLNIFTFMATEASSSFDVLPATLSVGARYEMPFYRKLSAGLLGTVQTGKFGGYDLRAGLTLSPANILSIAGSYGITSFGSAAGAAVSIKIPGINIFAGIDGFFGEMTPNFIPINKINTTFKLGVTLVFGKNKK